LWHLHSVADLKRKILRYIRLYQNLQTLPMEIRRPS